VAVDEGGMMEQVLVQKQALGQRIGFVTTICAGSFLLFLVQPMIARMALPRLGGAPSVWNSAMLVYQALLLGGYAYAHWLGRFAPRTQAAIHVAGFVLAALMLPIGLMATTPPPNANPFLWVPWLLVLSIGPLFFMVAAQAPLMQRWFALSGGENPYPLYAASNLGSFGGLIAYPLLVEPLLPIAEQRWLWSAGYIIVLLQIALCALSLPKQRANEAAAKPVAPPPLKTVAYWILLAAVPSGLMLSTSLYLTTDIVAMPMLWVVPLGLYLLSFSVAFATDRRLAWFIGLITPTTLVFAAGSAFPNAAGRPIIYASVGLLMLFAVSVALHSKMFDRRPDPQHLTRFYLAMSVGGVVGGIFCALVAPLIFNWAYEYPLLIALAGFLVGNVPMLASGRWNDARWRAPLTWALLLVAFGLSFITEGGLHPSGNAVLSVIIVMGICLFCGFALGKRIPFALSLIVFMLAMQGWPRVAQSLQPGVMTRSFFGIYAIRDNPGKDRMLVHGTTIHGVQNQGSEARLRMLTTYYSKLSGVGLVMQAAPSFYGPNARIDVVGLGAGTLSCYNRPGQNWRIYEIDPAIVAIARDPKRFTFLSKCAPNVPIIVGDARLMLARAPAAGADILAVDAFSSDSVPMHLLTREAFETYQRRLAPGGILLIHISNRYLNLEPVLAAAQTHGWTARFRGFVSSEADRLDNISSSHWVAFARDPKVLERLIARTPGEEWRKLEQRPGFTPWTDDYGSILPIIRIETQK
jgi:SAM-dependent methyltransferase